MRRGITTRCLRVILLIVAGALAAQVNSAQEKAEEIRSNNVPSSRGGAESEVLVRVDFPGLKNWRGIKSGAVLEGNLALPIYQGTKMAAPRGSQIRVTVKSAEKIQEATGFWKKMGRVSVRAFNPLETNRPSEYRVDLKTAELVMPLGNRVTLGAQGLRGRSGVMIRAKSGKSQKQETQSGVSLVMAVQPDRLDWDGVEAQVEAASAESTGRGTRAYILTELRASTNKEGDIFQAQLAEPARIEGRMVPAGTIIEGKVARSRPPRMLSRAGKMNLKLERMRVQGTDSLRVDGSLSGVESNGKAPFVLEDEGTLRGRKPGIWNGLMDVGYAYLVGKIADDVSEAPIRAIGGVMSDAAVANAARYVGITTGIVFLVTRHGRDVYVPKYAVIEIDFAERKQDELK